MSRLRHLAIVKVFEFTTSVLPLLFVVYLSGCGGGAGGGGTVHVPPDNLSPPVAEVVLETRVWGSGGPIEDRWENVSIHIRKAGENSPFQVINMELRGSNSGVATFAVEVPASLLVPEQSIEYFFTYDFDGQKGKRDAAGRPFVVPIKKLN